MVQLSRRNFLGGAMAIFDGSKVSLHSARRFSTARKCSCTLQENFRSVRKCSCTLQEDKRTP